MRIEKLITPFCENDKYVFYEKINKKCLENREKINEIIEFLQPENKDFYSELEIETKNWNRGYESGKSDLKQELLNKIKETIPYKSGSIDYKFFEKLINNK